MPNSAYLAWDRNKRRGQSVNVFIKVRFESKIIPSSLTEDTGIKCCPRKGTLMSSNLLKSCFIPKRISLVLSGLISKLFVEHQEAISRRSSKTFARQESMFSDEHERKTFVSSTIQHMTLHLASPTCWRYIPKRLIP